MTTALLRNAHYHFHPGNHAEVFGSEIFPSDIYEVSGIGSDLGTKLSFLVEWKAPLV